MTKATSNGRSRIRSTSANERVLKEFNHLCAICGAVKPQVHHIDENPANNEPLNLLPLCPNHHLSDAHDPTRPIDPLLLLLFRQHKDPLILSSRFEPIFRRFTPMLLVSDDEDLGDLYRNIRDLADFVRHLKMGKYYANIIDRLIHDIEELAHDPIHEDNLMFGGMVDGAIVKIIRQETPKLVRLLVEQIRYQDWPKLDLNRAVL